MSPLCSLLSFGRYVSVPLRFKGPICERIALDAHEALCKSALRMTTSLFCNGVGQVGSGLATSEKALLLRSAARLLGKFHSVFCQERCKAET